MGGNHCFYGPPPPRLAPASLWLRCTAPTPRAHLVVISHSEYREAIRRAITINMRLYSGSLSSLNLPCLTQPPPLHHFSVGLDAATLAGLIKVAGSGPDKLKRWRKYGAREALCLR